MMQLDTAPTVEMPVIMHPLEYRPIVIWEMIMQGSMPVLAFALWLISLNHVDLGAMADIGLISVMSPLTIAALALICLSFCWALQRGATSGILLLHVALLIFMLYGYTTLIEPEQRFNIVYRHAGYVEFMTRTGSVDTTLDAYFSWPGFFLVAAFFVKLLHMPDIMPMAAWTPVFLNAIYGLPLWMIFRAITPHHQTRWLALWIFYLSNWIGQDYFSPQGFNFFFYLIILAILITWFRGRDPQPFSFFEKLADRLGWFKQPARHFVAWLSEPDTYVRTPVDELPFKQRLLLLSLVLFIFGFVVCSHPLTPFSVVASVALLALFRRGVPGWLPIVMGLMVAAWMGLMTRDYLAGHIASLMNNLGSLTGALSTNVTSRVNQSSPGHQFIVQIRMIMTAFFWILAGLGFTWRARRGYHDVTLAILFVAPFMLFVAQSYGGEMLLRVYLFAIPSACFFIATLCYNVLNRPYIWYRLAIVSVLSLVLLGGFLFTRYGNERQDYMTVAEVQGIHELYALAPKGSALVQLWDGAPWKFQDFEQYGYASLADSDANVTALFNYDEPTVYQFFDAQTNRSSRTVYLVLTRSERTTFEMMSGAPVTVYDQTIQAFQKSGKFEIAYQNADTLILRYNPSQPPPFDDRATGDDLSPGSFVNLPAGWLLPHWL
jgi:hypothetical protein